MSWLEPYPDVLIDEPADGAPAPDAIYDTREAISLAFISALQLLPPRQRCGPRVRDVMGYHAHEVAAMLNATEQSVTSLLKRARATLHERWDRGRGPPPAPKVETAVVARLVTALEDGDANGLVVLLTDDVWLRMPPRRMEYQGREVAGRFFSTIAFRPRIDSSERFRPRPTFSPRSRIYEHDPHTDVLHTNGLFVLTFAGEQIRAITRFEATAVTRCGFPRIMAE